MGVRVLAAFAAAATLLLVGLCADASAQAGCPGDGAQPSAASASSAAQALLCDINALRAQRGLRPLRWDWRLQAAAQRLADDMAARHYASHVTPEGVGLPARVQPTGYTRKASRWALTENLGWGTNVFSTPASMVEGWMDSTPHRRNLLDPSMRDVGIGAAMGAITPGGEVGAIFVADFGARASVRSRAKARRARRR
jgi:uncharacterized protein YkwD